VMKAFGSVEALQSVSLTIRGGEFFSLLGPSGCGKTTLLRIIGGFETPSAGDVRIDGESVIDVPPYRRRTNMIFQHLALFPHLTVNENIAFGLEMKKRPRAQIRKRVDDALNLVRLGDLGERQIDELSGGQRQRVAMARALVNDPHVLLLDEPLGSLDLQLRLQMQGELRRLHKSLKGTFVFVTHDQGEAMTMSDRIAVMDRGRVLQVGTPYEIYEHPEHRFVAEFMGHSNFIPCRVIAAGEGGYVVVEGAGLRIEGRCRSRPSPGSAATVALRYERIAVEGADASTGTDQGVVATVTDVTYMGSTVRVEARLPGDIFLWADIPASGRRPVLAPGRQARFTWTRDSAVVLSD
jgi:spermidine/putrescine ABC transporter ATP-binding subunit